MARIVASLLGIVLVVVLVGVVALVVWSAGEPAPVVDALGIGTTRAMRSVVTGVFVPSWLTRSYTATEKLNLWRGKAYSASMLRDAMVATDLAREVTRLEVPVYFLHGARRASSPTPGARTRPGHG